MDVLRMDHFCPWAGNCIGFRNHKFLIQVGCYSFAFALVALLTSVPVLTEVFDGIVGRRSVTLNRDEVLHIAFGMLDLLVLFYSGWLSASQIKLALENKTTIEAAYVNMSHP